MSRPSPPRTWVIAHRGASRDYPENTLAAFDEALRQGADGIELDLQLSRDGVPVVYHDKTLSRAGGGRKRVAGLDLDELRRLGTGGPLDTGRERQHIPTLEQVLRRYAHRTTLLLEIKAREGAEGADRHRELARTASGLVRSLKLENRVLLLSFDTGVLEACRRAAPRVRRVLNLRPPPTLRKSISERLASLFALSVDVRTLTAGFAASVRRSGRPLLVYTCNTPRRVDRAIRAGAIGVMSDRPGWLAGHLEQRRAHGT